MIKIFYIANIRLPTEKAHGIQIMKMCEAFADGGTNVELIVSSRKTAIPDDPFDYYKVRRSFSIKKLWCIDSVRFGRAGFLFESFTFGISAKLYALFHRGVFYTRDEYLAFILRLMGKDVVWESHTGKKNFFVRTLVRMNTKIVVITKGLAHVYMQMGASAKNILIAPDGVDIDQFAIREEKGVVRTRLGIGVKEKIVLYTGHLYSWKGADTLAEAAKLISKDIQVYFVGGTDNDIVSLRKKYGAAENIKILGRKPHEEMPFYMRAADILIIPNSAKEDVSRLYTSPMKLFEYMASGTPIIASDLPSLKEIVNNSNASFFIPDNPKNLAEAISHVFENYPGALEKAAEGQKNIHQYSWKKRAEHIVSFVL